MHLHPKSLPRYIPLSNGLVGHGGPLVTPGQHPKYLLFTFLGVLALVGCGRQEINARLPASNGSHEVALKLATTTETTKRAGNTLAYEHTVSIEIKDDNLAARIRDVRNACGSRENFACTLLDVDLRTELDVRGGSVRMRLAPTAVEALIGIAAQGGRITSRGTHAEDLAEPISDVEREHRRQQAD